MKASLRIPQNEAGNKVPDFSDSAEVSSSMAAPFGEDVADWPTMPTAVRDKLLTIRDIAKDKNASANRIADELQAERLKLLSWEDRLGDVQKDHDHGIDGAAARQQAEHEIRLAKAKVSRLDKRSAELSQAWRPAAQLRKAIEHYLRDVAKNGVVLYDGPAPQLKSGEKALPALERAARRTRTLKADYRDVQGAPFPPEHAKQLAAAVISEWADAARPDVADMVYRGIAKIDFPKNRIVLDQYPVTTPGSINIVDPIALMALLNPQALQVIVDAEIDAELDGKVALTAEQRIEKLTEIAGDILASEREECFFSELAGLLPRADIDPRAFLGLHSSMPTSKGR